MINVSVFSINNDLLLTPNGGLGKTSDFTFMGNAKANITGEVLDSRLVLTSYGIGLHVVVVLQMRITMS